MRALNKKLTSIDKDRKTISVSRVLHIYVLNQNNHPNYQLHIILRS
jgi:hypothetical protein